MIASGGWCRNDSSATGNCMPEVFREIPDRHREMPYRCLLQCVAARRLASHPGRGRVRLAPTRLLRTSLADICLHQRTACGTTGAPTPVCSASNRLLRRIRTFRLSPGDSGCSAGCPAAPARDGRAVLGCEDWERRDPAHPGGDPGAPAGVRDGLPERLRQGQPAVRAGHRERWTVFRAISSARQLYGYSLPSASSSSA